MSRNLNLPFFPVPPPQYAQQYFSELIRSFSVYLENQQNPGEGRNTALTLTALQEDDVDLEVGALFQQAGTVKIVRLNVPHLRGSSGTGAVGAVTVVVSCANCGNDVDTPEELASYPSGSCPECGNSWTGTETKSTTIRVTVPAALGADTM